MKNLVLASVYTFVGVVVGVIGFFGTFWEAMNYKLPTNVWWGDQILLAIAHIVLPIAFGFAGVMLSCYGYDYLKKRIRGRRM